VENLASNTFAFSVGGAVFFICLSCHSLFRSIVLIVIFFCSISCLFGQCFGRKCFLFFKCFPLLTGLVILYFYTSVQPIAIYTETFFYSSYRHAWRVFCYLRLFGIFFLC
jgi:hypothetical protein